MIEEKVIGIIIGIMLAIAFVMLKTMVTEYREWKTEELKELERKVRRQEQRLDRIEIEMLKRGKK